MSAELEALAGEAAAIDLEAAPQVIETAPSPGDAVALPVNPAESLAGMLQVLGIAAGYGGFPKAASIWNPDTCRAVADKTVPVLVKYAWGQRMLDFLATGAGVEELALLATVAPLALSTVSAAREDMKPAKPAPAEPTDPARIE